MTGRQGGVEDYVHDMTRVVVRAPLDTFYVRLPAQWFMTCVLLYGPIMVHFSTKYIRNIRNAFRPHSSRIKDVFKEIYLGT